MDWNMMMISANISQMTATLRVAFRCFYMHMTIILGRASLVPMHRVATKYLHDFLFRSV